MSGSLDDYDVTVVDGREVVLIVVVHPSGLVQAGFNGITKWAAAQLVRDLADQWEREQATEEN